MLYADDLILLAKSANDLQQQINTLADYAETWNLEINTDKTKVLIFNKSTKTSNNVWKINDTVIEELTTYTYLGIKCYKNGPFDKLVGELKNKGRKCLFSLIAKNKEWRDLVYFCISLIKL